MSETITQTAPPASPGALKTIVDIPGLLWFDLDDPMSSDLDDLALRYKFHELAIEDCRHHIQLAKLDYYEGYSFVIINSTHYSVVPCEVQVREIDAFLGPDYIVTVHDGASAAVAEIQKRIASNAQHLTRPDQVLHAMIDLVVDRYLPTLDHIGDTIDEVEDELLISPTSTHLQTIFELKRGMLQFRRAVSSQRELLKEDRKSVV